MKMRYLWLSVLATASVVATASASTYTVEPTEPTHNRAFIADGVTLSPVFLPKSKIPDIPLTPPLLAAPIESYNFDTNPILNGFFLIPPDPHCAVGPDHIVNIGNCVIEWRPKVGTVDPPQYQSSLVGFFAGTPGMLAGDIGFDPKVVYDQYSGRFVVVTLQVWDTGAGDPSNESRILVAVSKGSDPNLGWWLYAINSKLVINALERWADYPGLAVDDKAVYICNNMFAFSAGGFGGVGSRLWIINKVPTYAGGGIAFTLQDPYGATPGSVNTTTQPAHMYGAPPNDALGRPLGTFLVSYSGLQDGIQNFVQVIAVSDPLGTVGGPFFAQQFVPVGLIDTFAGGLLDAPQLGNPNLIEVNDRRALNAVWRNNNLYMSATIRPPAGADLGQTTAHWWRVGTAAPVPGLALADQGNVGSEDLGLNTYTYFPSVMVDCHDNMAIGFSASNPAIYGGAYYATRLAGDPAGSIGNTGTLQVGLDFYNRRFGAANRNRWGDYSGIAVCPTDEATFYVYNEYAGPRGTVLPQFPAEDGRFHTKLGWFQIEPPCNVISVAITKFDVTAKYGVVSITSEFRSDLGVEAVELYRATGDGEFSTIEVSYDSFDRFDFTDRTVVPGTAYRYQIAVKDADGEFWSPIETVSVPMSGTALAQNTPNPFNPNTMIRYQLADKEHVTLAIYDANGQLVRTLVDETRPLGNNEVAWDGRSDAGLPVGSGVYFYRLTAGKFSEARKMVLLK
jgi:hypothetical protein